MSKAKPPEARVPLPDPDDVLRVMLNTPPQPHVTKTKTGKRAKKKPAK